MAELAQQERLQPSLLDRLTDDRPGDRKETRDSRVLSVQKLRESVRRDLVWLLNCVNLDSSEDLADYPFVSHSVLNYGLPDLTGHTASNLDVGEVERALRQAIWDFEPRILRDSVKVRAVIPKDRTLHSPVVFEVEGDLWAHPLPLHVLLRTEVDLEDGSVTITDRGG